MKPRVPISHNSISYLPNKFQVNKTNDLHVIASTTCYLSTWAEMSKLQGPHLENPTNLPFFSGLPLVNTKKLS